MNEQGASLVILQRNLRCNIKFVHRQQDIDNSGIFLSYTYLVFDSC